MCETLRCIVTRRDVGDLILSEINEDILMKQLFIIFVLCQPLLILTADQTARPNIVFVLVDDLGWSDLACYGNRWHETPNLDRLAADGMRFTNGYSPAPICSAARASILTGRTPARLGFEFVTKNIPGVQNIDASVPLTAPAFTLDLPLSEQTIAEKLKRLNYQTAFFGKWHVSRHHERYLGWHPQFGPTQQGFEIAEEDFGDHPYGWNKKQEPKELAKGAFPDDSMINRTAKFIRSEHDRPFFVTVSTFYVHTPVKNRCRWLVEKYDHMIPMDATNRAKRIEYAAFVETLDHHVGTILDAIDESGQYDETLVFFISDNGGHPEFCSNSPLRGSKWNLYEGGIRVPLILRWPCRIKPGTISDTPVVGYDIFPTLVDVAGGTAEDVDGISITPIFKDPKWHPPRSLIWHFPYYHPEKNFHKALEQIGVNDFAVSKTRPQSALRQGNYKIIRFAEDDRVELYDLAADISEQKDICIQQPDLASDLEMKLSRQLDTMHARRAIPFSDTK